MMKLEIIIGSYQELKQNCDLVRYSVFVQEQNVPENIEMDDRDPLCRHIVIEIDYTPIATGRIDIAKEGKIGRVAVIKDYRNKGYGSLIVHKLEKIAQEEGLTSVWLNAQKPSINFYQRLGYQVISDEFIEANIVHQKMSKKLLQNQAQIMTKIS